MRDPVSNKDYKGTREVLMRGTREQIKRKGYEMNY